LFETGRQSAVKAKSSAPIGDPVGDNNKTRGQRTRRKSNMLPGGASIRLR